MIKNKFNAKKGAAAVTAAVTVTIMLIVALEHGAAPSSVQQASTPSDRTTGPRITSETLKMTQLYQPT